MQLLPVKADDIRAIGYDPASHRLEVEFRRGDVYEFYQVPPTSYDLLMNSEQLDRHFHTYIRDRYPFLRIR